MQLRVDGRVCRVLIDTGSTDTIICAPFYAQLRPRRVYVTTISGGSLRCRAVGSVEVETLTGRRAVLEALVVDQRPLGADMVLGMSGIGALGGVTVLSPDDTRFFAAGSRAPLAVDAPDFSVRFESRFAVRVGSSRDGVHLLSQRQVLDDVIPAVRRLVHPAL